MKSKRGPDWFLLGMVGAALLAWVFPEPGARGGWLKPELTNKLGVALIFFLHGLLLPFTALREGTLHWRLHLTVQASTFLICPVFGWLFLQVIGEWLNPALGLGLFYLCALPSTVSSSVALTAAAGGNVAAAVFNATLSSVLGVVLTPLWVGIVFGGSDVALPLGAVVVDLACWLLLPLLLGQACRPVFGAWATKNKPAINVVDRLTLLLLIYTSFCDSVKAGVWSESGVEALGISVGFSCVLLALLLWFSNAVAKRLGFGLRDRIVIVFCGSKKTLASGVPMARVMFALNPSLSLILLPIMIYHPLQLFVCSWLARRFATQTSLEQ